jgi:hypothetical protein
VGSPKDEASVGHSKVYRGWAPLIRDRVLCNDAEKKATNYGMQVMHGRTAWGVQGGRGSKTLTLWMATE